MKYKLIASLYPAFILLLAINDVGKARPISDNPTYTGELVLSAGIVVIPIAFIAFLSGMFFERYKNK